MKRVNLI